MSKPSSSKEAASVLGMTRPNPSVPSAEDEKLLSKAHDSFDSSDCASTGNDDTDFLQPRSTSPSPEDEKLLSKAPGSVDDSAGGAGASTGNDDIDSLQPRSTSPSHGENKESTKGTRKLGKVRKLCQTYGFIQCYERQEKWLLFHFSQLCGKAEDLSLGDTVEFELVNDKITKKVIAGKVAIVVPEVSVREEEYKGIVTTDPRADKSGGGHPGNVCYENRGELFYFPYNVEDVEASSALRTGDKVTFNVVKGPEGNLRATKVKHESDVASIPTKHQGVVSLVKGRFGFIQRPDSAKEIFFHFSEVRSNQLLKPGDEVQFSIQQRYGREVACKIFKLPSEPSILVAIQEPICTRDQGGLVISESEELNVLQRMPMTSPSEDAGTCSAEYVGSVGLPSGMVFENSFLPKSRANLGFIVSLKDGYGFIQKSAEDRNIFFHFNSYDGDPTSLRVGMEVVYTLDGRRPCNSPRPCPSAEDVVPVPEGTMSSRVTVNQQMFIGKVVRSFWTATGETKASPGFIRVIHAPGGRFEFNVGGLARKDEVPREGDTVQFQISSCGKAVNIMIVRERKKATVDLIRGRTGFLSYLADDGRKLFFHLSEVRQGETIKEGDEVEFLVVFNIHNGKYFACDIAKLGEQPKRPERLVKMLRNTVIEEAGPRVIAIRQPRGPGEHGFSPDMRRPRKPGQLLDDEH